MRDINELSIYDFSDYRSFLNSYVAAMKQRDPQWSLMSWGRKMGIDRVTSLTVILTGQRRIGPKSLKKLLQYFQFTPEEENYFQWLVRREDVRGDKALFEKLDEEVKSLSYKPKRKWIADDQFSFVADWYHMAIHQMANIRPLENDPQWIQKKLKKKVPLKDIQQAIENLILIGALERKENYLYVKTQAFRTAQDVPSSAVRKFHSQMIDNAKDALENMSVSERDFQGKILPIPQEKLEEAKKLIREFFKEFGRKMDLENSDSVFQLNIQFFPLTSNLESKGVE